MKLGKAGRLRSVCAFRLPPVRTTVFVTVRDNAASLVEGREGPVECAPEADEHGIVDLNAVVIMLGYGKAAG
jgi:hypothetical protein